MTTPEPACPIPDLTPDTYATWRASGIGATTERLERALVLDLLGDVNGRTVLDVGCGDGSFALDLAERGAVVTGIDSAAGMIAAAERLARQHDASITFRVAAAGHLPYPTEQFDIVTAITILCFVDDAAPVFREIARVLRPGGRLVIGELGKWSTWAAERRLRAWLGSRLWQRGRFRTATELRGFARDAGLAVERVGGAIYYPRWGFAAHVLSPLESRLSRLTTVGAAFLALAATKPP